MFTGPGGECYERSPRNFTWSGVFLPIFGAKRHAGLLQNCRVARQAQPSRIPPIDLLFMDIYREWKHVDRIEFRVCLLLNIFVLLKGNQSEVLEENHILIQISYWNPYTQNRFDRPFWSVTLTVRHPEKETWNRTLWFMKLKQPSDD